VTDYPAKSEKDALEAHQPDELLIEAIDEQALHESRERSAARVRLLWNRRRLLIRATIYGMVLAIVIALLLPNRYQSTAELMPPDQSSGGGAALMAALSGGGGGVLGGIGGGLASMAQNVLGIQTTGDLFIGILKSDTVLDDVIQKFDLQKVYKTHYVEDTRKALLQHTDIYADSKSGIIYITVTDHNPRRAATMAQEYVNELNWVVTHLSTSSAHRERVFLDQRLKQVKTDLEDSEKQFSQFASQKGAIDIPEQGKAMVTAAATLQGQLIATEAELQSLQQVYTNNNVRVRSLQAQVNELRHQLEKLAGKGANENSSAQQLYPSLRELPLLGVTYADLLRRMKVEEAVFEVLTQEDELARVQEAKDTPSVKVLDRPLVPDKKSFPPRTLIVLLGMMLAFAGAVAWTLANSAWQAVDLKDPRKAVVTEVWSDVHGMLPWNSQNGSPNGESKRWLWNRFRRTGNDSSDE
jgi:uncharacterized protein involved in exopolysaccharide biosynthesis